MNLRERYIVVRVSEFPILETDRLILRQVTKADALAAEDSHNSTEIFGKTPDEWVEYTGYLVNEGLEDVKRGINATHILQEFILMGVLVGKGYSPEKAYETVEEWEKTGESKLLQQSKNM